MSLPIDRTSKSTLDSNLVNGNTSDAPTIKASNDVVYNTIDELYNKVIALTSATIGSANIPGVSGSNTYDQLVSLKSQINSLVLGAIPDGTITLAKLAADVQARINQIYSVEREVINLKAISTLANRVDGASGLFYDLNDGLNGGSAGKIDLTTTNIPATTPIGVTTVTVNSVTGFAVGQEVTILDDVNLERMLISAINAGTKVITFTASFTKAFKAGAQFCRSSVVQDTTNKLLKFGGWSNIATITSPITVVASAYDTSGNGGRKLVRLSNGWIVFAVRDTSASPASIILYITKDNFATIPTRLCYIQQVSGSALTDVSLTSKGNMVYVLGVLGGTGITPVFWAIDATTQSDINRYSVSRLDIDTGQTAMGVSASLAIDGTGALHAAWVSKNATYPNSFNIRYSKSTDGGTTWAAPTQITSDNTAGTDNTLPCISTKSNNNPKLDYFKVTSTTWAILSQYYNGTSWVAATTPPYVATATYVQSSPSNIIKQNGSNIGRIFTGWHGYDSTDTAKFNIHIAYSDDGGINHTVIGKITSGNTVDRKNVVFSEDSSGNIFAIYQDSTGITYQSCANGGTTFAGVATLNATGTNPATIERLDFSVPLTVYMDASQVKFKGTWQTAGSATPVLVEDVRYNITPPSNVSSIVAWVDHDADANYSVTGAASFQASGGNEIYTALTKTTAAIDSTHNEDQFTGSGTAAAKATLRLTLTRNSTSLVKNISQITGAAAL